jgi:hypothetical protein
VASAVTVQGHEDTSIGQVGDGRRAARWLLVKAVPQGASPA